MNSRIVCLPALFLLSASLLHADVVVLRNGTRIEGKILGQTRQNVRIKDTTSTRVIAKGLVRRIIYGPYDPDRARKAAEARRKAQQEAIRKQQQAARWKRQQAAALKQQLDAFKQLEEARREAARRAADEAEQQAVAKRQTIDEPPATETAGTKTPLWLSFMVPGLHQLRSGSTTRGSLLAAGTILGLGATAALEGRRQGLVGQYRATDELLNLTILGGEGGGGLDLLLSLQRDAVAAGINRATTSQTGAAGLVGVIYLVNALDVILFSGDSTALRLHSTPEYAGLAFEIRF